MTVVAALFVRVETQDQYTVMKGFKFASDNQLFPSDWWTRKTPLPYNLSFIRTDLTDTFSNLQNRIEVINLELDEGVSKIHFMSMGDQNHIGGADQNGSFWGPAKNAEEAKQVAEYFGYREP